MVAVAVVALGLVAAGGGVRGLVGGSGRTDVGVSAAAAVMPSLSVPPSGPLAVGPREGSASGAPSASPTRPGPRAQDLPAQDVAAGLRSRTVPRTGTGRLAVVRGDEKAPGRGRVLRVRVEVEQGLDVDRGAFARFVLTTLNDRRGWGRGGRLTFARTDGTPDMRVILASPTTSAELCRPLVTLGRVSCGTAGRAVLTYFRWVTGTPDYGDDRTGYRRYLVNHEVGHLLGYRHEPCPGKGRRAPVMQQQTKGLKGCTKNSWPFP